MFRAMFLAVAAAAVLSSSAAVAADQPVYGPAPAWVKALPIPKPGAGGPGVDGGPTKVLLYNSQSRLTPELDEYYTEVASQVLSPQGLASLGNLQETWDPATETLVINRLQVLRGGQTIDLLAGGRKFTVLRRESNLDSAMLDGRLTASLQPEGLQVGDVLDMAYTVQMRDPALGGYSTHFASLSHQGIANRVYLRTLWPSALPIHWKETDGLKAPVVSHPPGLTEVVVDDSEVENPRGPVSAPARFQDLASISFSQYRDWAELSGQFAPLYDKAATLGAASAVRREAEKIAAQTKDPKARTLAALRLVQDQVRYVFLGMNDGGLVPAAADETWSRRFGDCKGKTVLLVALLRALGVEAQPALVNTTEGDGMDARLPTAGWFDHAIVRASVGGKTYWLDGTRAGDRNLNSLIVPPFGWALPLATPGVPLERLDPAALSEPSADQSFNIDASKGLGTPAPAKLVIVYRSENAVSTRATLANMTRVDFERGVRESLAKTYSWFNVATLTIEEEAGSDAVRITAEGSGKLDWTDVTGGRIYRVPGTAFGGQIAKRQPGLHADAPYAVPFPLYTRNAWRITFPLGPAYSLYSRDIDRTIAGLALKRTSKMVGGVLFIDITARSVAKEFPASEADAAADGWRELGRSDVAVGLATPPAAPSYALKPAQAAPQVTYKGLPAAVAAQTAVLARADEATAADQAAAAGGDGAAQYRMAQRYTRGEGVAQDNHEAVGWLQKAAAAGNLDAEIALGQAYADGRGLPADLAQAIVWFRKAAEQGSATGQRLLGQAYMRGEGLPTDEAQARVWLERAAAQGDRPAKRLLEQLGPAAH